MSNEICKYINASNDNPCNALIGKLAYCEKENGKTFVAKLIAIKDKMLVFQTKTGEIILDRFDSLKHISEMKRGDA
jgi:hypothetical protein